MDSRSSSIFSITVANLSASMVAATCMKAAIGLDLPILASYANAVGGAICPRALSLGKIIYRASTVYSVRAVLST